MGRDCPINPLTILPMKMKQAISQALFDHALMSKERKESREALSRLVHLLRTLPSNLRTLRSKLSKFQRDLRPENIIDQVEGLIEQAYAVQKTAELELERRPKSKGGRPPQLDRDVLVLNLIGIFAQFSGKRVGLSRSPEKQNPDRVKASGPSYRFVSTILKKSNLSTRGIEHVIERAARHAKNQSPEN
jgi:hypothetical protein